MEHATTLRQALAEIEAVRGNFSAAATENKAVNAAVNANEASMLNGYTPPVGFEPQMRAFADALDMEQPPPVTIMDARRSVMLLSAIYDSVRSGEIIELPRLNL